MSIVSASDNATNNDCQTIVEEAEYAQIDNFDESNYEITDCNDIALTENAYENNITYEIMLSPEKIYEGEDSYVTLNLPEDAKGNLNAYELFIEYDPFSDTYGAEFKLIETTPLVNGSANITITGLEYGTHYIYANYTGNDYNTTFDNITDLETTILRGEYTTTVTVSHPPTNTTEIILTPREIHVGEDSYVTLNLPADAKGNLNAYELFIEYDPFSDTYGAEFKLIETTPLVNGSANITITGLEYGTHYIYANYTENDYNTTFDNITDLETTIIRGEYTTAVVVDYKKAILTAEYDNGDIIATLKDENGNPVSGLKVGFAINGVKYVTSDSNGRAKYSVRNMADGKYKAKVMAYCNGIYADSNQEIVEFTLNRTATKLTAKYDKDSKNIVATVKDADGNPVSGLKVGFAINGVKYAVTDENGQARYPTENLTDGTYTAKVMAYGNEIYKDSNKETVTFTVANHEQSKIYLRNALYFVLQTKIVQVTLWDANNNPIANKTVHIQLNDDPWKYSGVTDENGNAYIRVGVGFGVHNATVSFDGDENYTASEKAGYVRVIKETPSVMVRGADSQFKASDSQKIVKVYLRDRYDKPLPANSLIAIKINGQTYVGSTDSDGIASIQIYLDKTGTYDAQAIYAGNSAYNPVTRNIKIYVK